MPRELLKIEIYRSDVPGVNRFKVIYIGRLRLKFDIRRDTFSFYSGLILKFTNKLFKVRNK